MCTAAGFAAASTTYVNAPTPGWRRAGPELSPEKDTLRNLRTTGECVINIVTEALVAVMNQTCGDYPPQTSEIAALGIATAPWLVLLFKSDHYGEMALLTQIMFPMLALVAIAARLAK